LLATLSITYRATTWHKSSTACRATSACFAD
jgi:hypothetical protein